MTPADTPDGQDKQPYNNNDDALDTIIPASDAGDSGAHNPDNSGASTSLETVVDDTNQERHLDTASSYNLRQNRTRSYNHRLSHLMDNPVSNRSIEPAGTQHFQVSPRCEAPVNVKKRSWLHGWVMTQCLPGLVFVALGMPPGTQCVASFNNSTTKAFSIPCKLTPSPLTLVNKCSDALTLSKRSATER